MDWADEKAAALSGGIAELEPAIAAALRAARADALEEAAKVAKDRTPAKHDGTLAAHVTGATIERDIRALLTEEPADADR